METQADPCELGVRNLDILTHPDEGIADRPLSQLEKRAILGNCASDARVIEGAPELRQLDNGAFVRIDTVLNTLRLLDSAADHMSQSPFPRRRKAPVGGQIRGHYYSDDEPPPCASGASIPARPIYTVVKAGPLSKAA